MQFTKAQEAAMTARGRTLLVSAAAGSGKTFTLTQRIIRSIIEEGRDISRLLIVTFTRAAAGELRAKISKALSEAIAENPGNAHLQKQLLLLGSAKISTIDSFFSEPVRANFEKLGLPASMRLADEAELSPIRESAMKEVLDRFYEGCEGLSEGRLSEVGQKERFTDLVGIISAARDSSNLIPTLLEIYGKLITAPEGVGRLQKATERLRAAASTDFFKTAEGGVIRDKLKELVDYTAAAFGKCCDEMAKDPILCDKYIPCFDQNKTLCVSLSEILKQGSYEEVRAAFDAYAPSRIPSLRGNEKSETAERYKDLRGKKLNPAIKSAAKTYLSMTREEIAYCFAESAEFCMMISRILTEYERIYSEEKLRRGLCEFSDMPKFMLRLLSDENKQPTEYARHLSESFDEVYIDEYQDVNEIQDRIFELIGGNRRFMVGDIKQSIYGFREAEPSIFAEYRRRFPLYDPDSPDDENEGGNTIFMSNNFRCDENVIRFTNLVCSVIFSAFAESIGYTSDDDLIFSKGRPTEDYVSPKVTVNLIGAMPKAEVDEAASEDGDEYDEGESDGGASGTLYDEAVVTANAIAELIRSAKKADGTATRAGDIAILVRSHSHAKPLVSALQRLNIKCAVSAKTELFDGKEMKLLVDLLSVIDNPRADVPLCNLLTSERGSLSPFFTLEEVITIRKHAPSSRSLFDALLDYGSDGENEEIALRCREFDSSLQRLRLLSAKLSADKLLRAISHNEIYSPLCESDAYTYLYDCACKYVRNAWNGLYSFLSYFKKLIEKGESGAEGGKSDGDAVTVMTIHQSKGLEFNTCFLFGMGKQFNLADSRSPLLFCKELGLSLKLPPMHTEPADPLESIRVRYQENSLWRAADLRIKDSQVEEEARILYVALTRARERLYLSATLRKPVADYLAELDACADTVYEIRSSRSYIRQILLAIRAARLENNNDIFTLNGFIKGQNALTEPLSPSDTAEAVLNTGDGREYSLAKILSQKSTQDDDERLLSTIPAKVAASKVSPSMLEDSVFIPIPTGKLFGEIMGAENADAGKNPGTEPSSLESDNERHVRARIELMRSARVDFDSLLAVNKKPTAAEKGTATHLFLQYCDYENAAKNGIDSEIERLRDARFITERVAQIIDRRQLAGFFKSELFAHIRDAARIHREFHFGMFRGAEDFTEDEELAELVKGKKIFVQGSVDLIIEKSDGQIILCDYKTDRITSAERADRDLLVKNLAERHGRQLAEYRFAVERIFGHAPSHVYIYSVPLGDVIEIG